MTLLRYFVAYNTFITFHITFCITCNILSRYTNKIYNLLHRNTFRKIVKANKYISRELNGNYNWHCKMEDASFQLSLFLSDCCLVVVRLIIPGGTIQLNFRISFLNNHPWTVLLYITLFMTNYGLIPFFLSSFATSSFSTSSMAFFVCYNNAWHTQKEEKHVLHLPWATFNNPLS